MLTIRLTAILGGGWLACDRAKKYPVPWHYSSEILDPLGQSDQYKCRFSTGMTVRHQEQPCPCIRTIHGVYNRWGRHPTDVSRKRPGFIPAFDWCCLSKRRYHQHRNGDYISEQINAHTHQAYIPCFSLSTTWYRLVVRDWLALNPKSYQLLVQEKISPTSKR